MIITGIKIIGAGPTGVFTVFEAGLLKLRCHLIDSLPQPGGQSAKRHIPDISPYIEILAGDSIDNLMQQVEPFYPRFTLASMSKPKRKRMTTDLSSLQIKAPHSKHLLELLLEA